MTDELDDERLRRLADAVETIEECLGRLVETRQTVDRETYRNDADAQALVERRFVKMSEAALDVGRVLIVGAGESPPDSNPETMQTLATLGVLPEPLATEMADAARFRNVFAHTYGQSIDHDVVYDALSDLERYRDFVLAVREDVGVDDGST